MINTILDELSKVDNPTEIIELIDSYKKYNFNVIQRYLHNHHQDDPILILLSALIKNKEQEAEYVTELYNKDQPEILDLLLTMLQEENNAFLNNNNESMDRIRTAIDQILQSTDDRDTWIEILEQSQDPIMQLWLIYIVKFIILSQNIDKFRVKLLAELEWFISLLSDLEYDVELVLMLRNFGNQSYRAGDVEVAISSFQRAYLLADELEMEHEIFGISNNLGILHRHLGNYDEAITFYERALELTQKPELHQYQSMVLNNLGALLFYKNDLDRSLAYYQQALQKSEDTSNQKIIASTIDNIGEVYYAKGQYNKAIEWFEDGLKIRLMHGIGLDIATSYDNIGNINKQKGELDVAQAYYQQSFEIRKQLGNMHLLAKSYRNLGTINHQMAKFEKAQEQFENVVAIWQDTDNYHELFKAWFNLILLAVDMNKTKNTQLFRTYKDLIFSTYNSLKMSDPEHITAEITHIKLITKALNFILNPRDRYKFNALSIFENIVHQIDYDFSLQFYVYIKMIEILIFELNTFYNPSAKNEINQLLETLHNTSREQHAMAKLYSLGLLEAEMALLDLDIRGAENLLLQYTLNSEEAGLKLISKGLNQFYLEFIEKKEQIALLAESDVPLEVILQSSSISSTIDKLSTINYASLLDEPNYEPLMFLMIKKESGINIFSQSFSSKIQINENLIAALLSTINSFLEEVFYYKEGLHQIDYGGNKILFDLEAGILFCYVVTGTSEVALKHLLLLKSTVIKNTSVWRRIVNFNSTDSTMISSLNTITADIIQQNKLQK